MADNAKMSVDRVQVTWGGSAAAGGGITSFYFQGAVGSAAQQRDAVVAFLTATEARRATSATWTLLTDVDRLNEVTGALESVNTVTAASGVGTGAGDIMPSLNQGLLRLLTTAIVNGRLLRGRIFLPGTIESDNSGGAPIVGYRTGYDTAAATLIAEANTIWSVWSRTHGVIFPITTASTWTQWSFLHGRRD